MVCQPGRRVRMNSIRGETSGRHSARHCELPGDFAAPHSAWQLDREKVCTLRYGLCWVLGRFSTVAEALAELPEVDEDRLVDLMTHVMGARETSAAEELTQAIELEGDPQAPELWRLLAEVGVLDARRAADLLRVRVETLEQLIASGGELADSPDPAAALQDNLWLIDPRWDLLQPRGPDGLVARDGSLSAVLTPSPPGEIDELLAVVIATEEATTDAAGPTLERLATAVDRARQGIPGTPVRVLVIADALDAGHARGMAKRRAAPRRRPPFPGGDASPPEQRTPTWRRRPATRSRTTDRRTPTTRSRLVRRLRRREAWCSRRSTRDARSRASPTARTSTCSFATARR